MQDTRTLGERLPDALTRIGRFFGSDAALNFVADIMALHVAASVHHEIKGCGSLPRSEDVELAIRANNMGGLEFNEEYCECDASVGQSPCQYCAIDTVLIRLWRIVDPAAASAARPVSVDVESPLIDGCEPIGPIPQGTWPQSCVQRAFVEGAEWWQFYGHGSTMFGSEREEAEQEAVKRYGQPDDDNTGVK